MQLASQIAAAGHQVAIQRRLGLETVTWVALIFRLCQIVQTGYE